MNELKEKAIKLRQKGYSYNLIKERINVSKSTLSNWLSKIEFIPNQTVIKRIGLAKLRSALFKQKLKFQSIKAAKEEAKKDIASISKRDLLMLGIGLYLGEGDKAHENIRFVNSDPKIIKLAMKWFTDICGAEMKNFKPYLHLYPDNDVKTSSRFWSEITGIPIEQFGKITIDKRKNKTTIKRRSLPHGTLHLQVKSNRAPNLGVKLHRKIMAWIEICLTDL